MWLWAVLHHYDPGAGLGLVTARRIVEAHGGLLTARPWAGRGATGVITLPAAAPPLAASLGGTVRNPLRRAADGANPGVRIGVAPALHSPPVTKDDT